MKKVLIFYTSVGLGHKSMAENIGAHLTQAGYQVKLEDILQVQSGSLVNVSKTIYLKLINSFPKLWTWFYTSKLWTKISLPLRIKVAARNHQRTLATINDFNPDIVITDQAAPSAVVAYLKQQGLYTKLFGIAFSDYHLHQYWLYNEADFYLANTVEQKQEMLALGINESKINVLGMTLQTHLPVDQNTVRQKLGIMPEDKVILVSGGSMGFGITADFVADLVEFLRDSLKRPYKVVAVCGNQQQLYTELKSRLLDNLLVFGYYTPMSELYPVADVFVGKPGGLSVAESLIHRLPIVITHWMPGGEELNVKYLSEHGLTLPIITSRHKQAEVFNQVLSELQTGQFKKSLDQRLAATKYLLNTDSQLIESVFAQL